MYFQKIRLPRVPRSNISVRSPPLAGSVCGSSSLSGFESDRSDGSEVLLPAVSMEYQGRCDASEVVSRNELLQAAGVEHGERDGVTVRGRERADEEAVLADHRVDAQGVLSGIVVRR